ncbi:MAG TPA: prolyl oligopeptidase family serine peptidase [Kofleriaceae bacterium]|nr:prolyl oligopeptidase family serine peptidase [Kofleriaceae bacterium]
MTATPPHNSPYRLTCAWICAAAIAACAGDVGPGPATASAAPLRARPAGPWPAATRMASPGLRTSTRPLPHDMAQLRDLRDAAISPDGNRVAYVVRAPRFDARARPSPEDTRGGWKVEQQLWIADRRGGVPLQLTFADQPVLAVRFSPDGRDLAFLRRRGAKPALHVLHLAGGEARPVDLGEHEPTTFEWTPDGRSFVFLAVRPRGEAEEQQRWKRGGAVAWHREWQPVQLFMVARGGGKPRRVGSGSDSVVSFRLSPDGKRVALVTAASTDPYETFTRNRLAVVRTSDGRTERELVRSPSVIPLVEWAPDGRSLAYATTSRGFSHIDELRVVRVGGGRSVDVAAGLDLSLVTFAWTADSRSLIAAALARTRTALYRIPAAGGKPTLLPRGERNVARMVADRRHRFAVAAGTSARAPTEPIVIDLATGRQSAVASLNPQVAKWSFAPTELVTWKNKEGVALEGLLTRTSSGGGSAPPLLVMPHGGPDSVSLDSWHPWAQYFAARGYSVFRPNYRGGIGYGRAFYEANRGRLGEIELIDIESGVDHLIATRKADPDRLFYGSWSWGGYLSAWTLGHSKRYRAIMVGAGVVDVAVQYVTSDINHGTVADWEFKGRPWSAPEAFERANPSRYLAGARTPTLIIHGQNDPRVGFINAQILHRALSDLGVEVVMWAYPREPHGFDEPAHVQHMFEVWAAFNDARLPR